MHKIGDTVLYGTVGVMKIIDIREESAFDTPRTYYVLTDPEGKSGSETLIPTDNKELTSRMRPLLSKEELREVIREGKNMPPEEWVSDNRRRADAYNKIMLSGDRRRIIAMIRAIHEAGLVRAKEGKKNFLSDENIMRKAEKLLFSEIATVMDITESEASDFVEAID